MERNDTNQPAEKGKVKAYLRNNLFTMIIACICAMVLWGFVLYNQNPERKKTLEEVSVGLEGEADLIARNLVLVGNRGEILPDVEVQVNIDLVNYTSYSENDVAVTVNLRSIKGEGEYDLPITCTATSGTVVKVIPSTVHVEVERLTSKYIPVTPEVKGELATGYWGGEPLLSIARIAVEGPYSVVSDISSAKCIVDVTGRTGSVYETVNLTLYDRDENTISSASLYGDMPAAIVTMEILPVKSVKLLADNVLVNAEDEERIDLRPGDVVVNGADDMSIDYEYVGVSISEEVLIIGEKADIDAISALSITGSVDVSEAEADFPFGVEVVVPEGIRIVNSEGDILENVTAEAYVDVEERIEEVTFEAIKVELRSIPAGTHVNLEFATVKIALRGLPSVIRSLRKSNVKAYVDCSDVTVNTTTVEILIEYASTAIKEGIRAVEVLPQPMNVTVALR